MSTNRDVHILSGAYSLDALSAEEAAAVEAEMARSEHLRGEVAELTDTAVMLGLAVAEQSPPPALRARILDAVATTPQLPAVPRATEEQDVPTSLSSPAAAAHVAPARRRARARRRPALLLSLAAVAALLFAGGIAVDHLVVQPQSAYAEIRVSPDAQESHVSIAGGGTATVTWSKRLGETAVVLDGVNHPAGTALQLWRMDGDSVTSAGLYEPGSGEHYVVLKGALASGEGLAVSVEPKAGSTQPTSTPRVLVRSA